MAGDAHPAAELIAEAKFARRMLDVVDASLDKIVAAAQPATPAGPTRLEVPTVNMAGWSDAVLYVIRTECAKTTPAREIAAMLERLFGVEASAHVVMSAVLHFDLDRTMDVPTPAERFVASVMPESAVLAPPALGKRFVTADMAVSGAAGASEARAEPASIADADPWVDEAKRLYDGGKGVVPFAIAKQLGRTDYEVRKAVIPGYGTREHRDNLRAQSARPAPSLPPVSAAKPSPQPVERKAISKAPPDPLPWTPPPRAETLPTDIPAAGKGVHILALTVDSCRWPMGKGEDGHETYCGCQKSSHGGSYCETHALRAHSPGAWPPRTPAPKRPTRMARSISALPAARNQRRA